MYLKEYSPHPFLEKVIFFMKKGIFCAFLTNSQDFQKSKEKFCKKKMFAPLPNTFFNPYSPPPPDIDQAQTYHTLVEDVGVGPNHFKYPHPCPWSCKEINGGNPFWVFATFYFRKCLFSFCWPLYLPPLTVWICLYPKHIAYYGPNSIEGSFPVKIIKC